MSEEPSIWTIENSWGSPLLKHVRGLFIEAPCLVRLFGQWYPFQLRGKGSEVMGHGMGRGAAVVGLEVEVDGRTMFITADEYELTTPNITIKPFDEFEDDPHSVFFFRLPDLSYIELGANTDGTIWKRMLPGDGSPGKWVQLVEKPDEDAILAAMVRPAGIVTADPPDEDEEK